MKKSFCFTLMILSLTACGNSQPQQEETGVSHQTMVTSRSDIALEQSYPASAVDRLSTWFQGKLRILLKGYPDDEITVSKEKVAAVKRWLDS